MATYHCTLAKVYNPDKHNVIGWMMSEKLDGVRALWLPNEQRFVSRSGKPLNVPPSWQKAMKRCRVPLDGEFFMGRGRFQDTVSAVRKKEPTEEQFTGVEYLVFDSPGEGDFPTRMIRARYAMQAHLAFDSVSELEHWPVRSLSELGRDYAAIVASGGEGIMIRNPRAEYELKRTSNLLKWKGEIDGRAIVTGHQPGEGKHEGRLGALLVREVPPTEGPAVNFKLGTGFSDREREHPPAIGQLVRWAAHERTRDNVPRHPRYLCIDEGD